MSSSGCPIAGLPSAASSTSSSGLVFSSIECSAHTSSEHKYSIIANLDRSTSVVDVSQAPLDSQSIKIDSIEDAGKCMPVNAEVQLLEANVAQDLGQVNIELLEGDNGGLLGDETYYVIDEGSIIVTGSKDEVQGELLELAGSQKRKAKSYLLRSKLHSEGQSYSDSTEQARSPAGRYACNECHMVFRQQKLLRQHTRSHHPMGKARVCALCSQSFATKAGLLKHLKEHQKQDLPEEGQQTSEAALDGLCSESDEHFVADDCSVRCEESSEEPLLKSALKAEVETGVCLSINSASSFRCHMCKKSYKVLSSLEKHLGAHKEIDCPVCHVSFSSFQDYKDHVAKHTKDEIARFRKESESNRKINSGKPPLLFGDNSIPSIKSDTITECSSDSSDRQMQKNFQCTECRKSFARQTDLEKHQYCHTGVAPWNCKHCCKSFLSSVKYKEHCLSHGDYTRPFHCSFCAKGFSNPEGLRAHERAHKGIRPYVCNTCGKTFTQKGNLKDHVLIHSEDRPWKCSMCDKAFRIKGDMTKHLVVHTGVKNYECQFCQQKFSRASYLSRHMRTHTGEKPYVCDICNKAFNRSENCMEHRRIHTGERPYICQCGATFKDSGNFCNHKKIHDPSHPKRKRARRARDDGLDVTFRPDHADGQLNHDDGNAVIQVLPGSFFDREDEPNISSGGQGMVSVRLLDASQVSEITSTTMDSRSCVSENSYVMHIGNLLSSIDGSPQIATLGHGPVDVSGEHFVTLDISDVRLLSMLQSSASDHTSLLQHVTSGQHVVVNDGSSPVNVFPNLGAEGTADLMISDPQDYSIG